HILFTCGGRLCRPPQVKRSILEGLRPFKPPACLCPRLIKNEDPYYRGAGSMARIKIVTDSTSDISLGMAHELGIEIVPMYLHVGEQTYRAGLDVTPDQFYQMMQDGRVKAMTSSPPPVVFEQLYRRLAPDYDYIFSLHLSGRLGGTVRAAQQARARLPASATRIEVVDSKLASMGLGLVAIHAAQAIRDGASASEVALLINTLIQHCHVVFFVDTIEYLEHTGRLSLATSVVGSMQRIKPLMLLD